MNETITPKRVTTSFAADMEKKARARVEGHSHFVGRARLFEFHCADNVLVVRGCVPSYYLKQVLQTELKGLVGVRRIDNQVTVRSSDGAVGNDDERGLYCSALC